MKQIIAIVKPYLADKLIQALADLPVEEISIREVKGYGRQKDYLEGYGENEYSLAFVPKVEISVWVCLLYTSPSPRDKRQSRMPSSA